MTHSASTEPLKLGDLVVAKGEFEDQHGDVQTMDEVYALVIGLDPQDNLDVEIVSTVGAGWVPSRVLERIDDEKRWLEGLRQKTLAVCIDTKGSA